MTSESANPAVIEIENVSKTFRLYASPLHRLGDILLGHRSHREHQALRDINLNVARGETVGVLGKNGAGKSTLLRLIAATTTAGTGTVRVAGRVSALLELGAGFHPEWTGRQNAEFYIRLMREPKKRARACLRDIEDFADIGQYFDQPLRTYSSGMFLRVAFAAAVSIEPDILIVDEALAVGDANFQHKCYQRIAELKARGVTILFVTHRADLISQICSRGIVLDGGRILFDGRPGDAVNCYVEQLFSAGNPQAGAQVFDPSENRIGTGGAKIMGVTVLRGSEQNPASFRSGETASFLVRVQFERDFERPVFGFALKTVEDIVLYSVDSEMVAAPLRPVKKGDVLTLHVDCPLPLPGGSVFADFVISGVSNGEARILDGMVSALKLTITGAGNFYGLIDLHATIRVMP